ncbi:Hypothetical predicted protein [Paramuricea clavata]|uniref:Uncharacterized protein n=1 Tax=Paramuricea clavata TaxID=317549 RepID=A0A7D9IQZ6_PARCT|nr:Hypothetical predicted protein [Paramuricea clavata]
MTSFSGGPLTEEEEYLLERFRILREKKKLLKKLKEKAETKVKPTVKRESVPTPSITPEDAKRKAEMLVASGCVKISKTSVSREFKRARTSEKKVAKDNLSDQELTTLVEKKPLQSTYAAEMREMYHSNFVKSGERRDNDSNGNHGHREENKGHREENRGYREENRGYREENKGYREENRGYREENRGYREENRGYREPRKVCFIAEESNIKHILYKGVFIQYEPN